jgi:hypothetical protein
MRCARSDLSTLEAVAEVTHKPVSDLPYPQSPALLHVEAEPDFPKPL